MLKKMKTSLRRFFFKYCPSFLLQKIIRQMIEIDYSYDSNLVVKIAETKEELEGAFRVLYQSYLEMGYCDQSESQMRLTIHHALPTTSVIIAKYKDEVVGTMTLVRNNNLRLPCEKEWSIDALKVDDRRVAEITSLAIDKRFRRIESGNILFPIFKFMYEFATDYFGTQILSIVIHPKERDFYEGLFFFQPLSEQVIEDYYGAPAMAMYMDLAVVKERLRKVCQNKAVKRNLYHYFTEFKSQNLIMPIRNSFSVDYPVLDKDLFQYFFFEKSNIGETVSDEMLEQILLHFPGSPEKGRISSRFTVDIQAQLFDLRSRLSYRVTIKNISETGLRIVTAENEIPMKLLNQQEYEIQFLSEDQLITMKLISQWNREGTQAGFRVTSNQLNWYRFLKTIHANYALSQDIQAVFRRRSIGKAA